MTRRTTKLSVNFWKLPWRRKHLRTRTHSDFALIGGFVIDTSSLRVKVLPERRSRGILTTSALKMIAQHVPYLLPDISMQEILLGSQANGPAKLVVCLQSGWFCVQALGQLASNGNPISLLELNTFLHGICCLAVLPHMKHGGRCHKILQIST